MEALINSRARVYPLRGTAKWQYPSKGSLTPEREGFLYGGLGV